MKTVNVLVNISAPSYDEKGSTPGIGGCTMKRDINIFGIELTGLTAKEAMK